MVARRPSMAGAVGLEVSTEWFMKSPWRCGERCKRSGAARFARHAFRSHGASLIPRVRLTDKAGSGTRLGTTCPRLNLVTRSPRTPLIGALLAVAGIALARVLAFGVPAIHHADAVTLHDFIAIDRESIYPLITDVAHVADPVPYGLLGALLIGIALGRGRGGSAAA